MKCVVCGKFAGWLIVFDAGHELRFCDYGCLKSWAKAKFWLIERYDERPKPATTADGVLT